MLTGIEDNITETDCTTETAEMTEKDNTTETDVTAETDNTTEIDGTTERNNSSENDAMGKTDDNGETGDNGETDDRNIAFGEETKIEKYVEERDTGQRIDHLQDENKIGKSSNNGERRIVRWKNGVGSIEDGCSSCSIIERKSKDTDPENPTATIGDMEEEETEPLSLFKSCEAAFNWNDFFYSFILGFLPTVWDVFSDIRIASQLKVEVDDETAGLSYLFICLPGITILFDLFSSRLTRNCSSGVVIVVTFILFSCTAGALTLCFFSDPLLLKYPSIVLGVFIVGIKGVCVFVHTPEMKEFATKVSVQEYSWESSLQFLLLLHIWINGGPLFISPLLSSGLIIGKVSTEFYLVSEPENLLQGKSFLEKLKLVERHLPLFTLTAFFRLGSSIIKHSSTITNIKDPFPTAFFFICVFVMCFVYFVLYSLAFVGLKFCFPILKDLSLPEASQSIISEFTTLTPWGRLKTTKKQVKKIQVGTPSEQRSADGNGHSHPAPQLWPHSCRHPAGCRKCLK